VTFDNEPFKLLNVQFYQQWKTSTHTVLRVFVRGGLSNPYLWLIENGVKGERIGHGPSTSVTLCLILAVANWVAHLNSHKAKPHQTLCSYYHIAGKTYRYLVSQDITQVLHASALHHPHFCVNPASMECCSLCTSSDMALFSCGLMPYSSNLLAIGILMECSATYMTSPAPHVRTVPTHACWWQSSALSRNSYHAPTQPIPICGLMGYQDHYRSHGLV
jgi:hypothetical protein